MIDIVVVLVMSVPMLLFAIYPGVKAGEFFEKRFDIAQDHKKTITIVTTIVFALTLSLFLHFYRF